MAARHRSSQQFLGQQAGSSSAPSTTPSGSSSKRRRTMSSTARKAAAALRGVYELVSMRGEGTFAEVWEARHLRTGHRVAIKIIPLSATCNCDCNAKKKKAVEREIRVMRLLRWQRHPHVARFYQAIRAADHTCVVMELAAQGTLHDHVAARLLLPEPEARRIFRQLVAAVAYCHCGMVVHRDLKMENVLLDASGDVKIADFGFSKLFSYDKLQYRRCGSPEYAAPELLEGRPYVGPEVDVWSCGIILYGMLCGGLPFNISKLARNIKRGELPFRVRPWVSEDARDLISRMLIVTPNKRATITDVVAHPWLQPADMPPYLRLPPAGIAHHHQQPDIVDATTVDLLVTRHGFDRAALLDLDCESESEAAVAYQLVLSHQYDAATRYHHYQHQQQLSMAMALPPPPPPQLVVGGPGAGECPMRRVGRALRQLGVRVLSRHHGYSSRQHRMVMVCGAHHKEDKVLFEMQLLFNQQQQQYALHLKRTSGPQLPYLGLCAQLASKLR